MKEEILTPQDRHQKILEMLYEKYKDSENDIMEFTWDGPSDWKKWEEQKPKILFLLKEAHSGFQPCIPNQKIENKTGRNISRWKNAIKLLFENSKDSPTFHANNILNETNDNIAIVEVKKLNEERPNSSYKVILDYAKNDKDLLKGQIDILDPQIIVCCNTN